MAERGDTHYNLPRLNRVFFVMAAALFACAIWMVLDDWDRDWKDYQREFQAMELERAREQVAAVETPEWVADKQGLEDEIRALQAGLDKNPEFLRLQDNLRAAEGLKYRTEAEYKTAQAKFNWQKYLYNQAKVAEGGAASDAEYRAAIGQLEEKRLDKEEALVALEAAAARMAVLAEARDGKQVRLASLEREVSQLRDRISVLEPGVFRSLRDAPALDFVAPSLKVRKQVLPRLRKNYNFNTVQRVDMCSTCHAAIDSPFYPDAPNPLRSHPQPELYMTPGSPHPIESFGCTVCHEGAAETLDFVRAVHMPDDEQQQEEWEEEYHWHRYHYWDWPMLPLKYTESSCYSCHAMGGTLESLSESAPKLTEGLHLFEVYGCYSCHNIKGWRVDRKPGPSLRRIAEKIEPDFARSWIAEPRHFRPSTKMPQVFFQENSVSEAWDETAVAAVQAYLWSVSEGPEVPPVPEELAAAADPGRGEALFLQVGCTACHNSAVSAPHEFSEYGADLTGIGSKVGADWLYSWISNPAGWWPDTRMPDLRLQPEDAADIASFLATQTLEDWEALPMPADEQQLEDQATAFLERRFSVAEAAAKLLGWEEEGRQRTLAEVGKEWIWRQGCYSCHDIPGFESAMPIGTDLSDWGNKNTHQLAFELWNDQVPGHFEGARDTTRPNFAELKLSNPRRFDRGLQVTALDRLRMPNFHLDEDQITALTTVLLGLKDESEFILEPAYPRPTELQKVLERGAFQVRRKNCYGCHKFGMDTIQAADEDGNPHDYLGLVTLEDEDEEATFFQLWKPDPDLAVEEEGGGDVGTTVFLPWQAENEDGDLVPWPVIQGVGGGIMPGLADYYVDAGEADSDVQAFPLMPPILYREGEKVRAPWVTQFLLAPYTLRPWLVVRMPSFKLDQEEARSLAQYFTALSVQEWPSWYVRELRSRRQLTAEDLTAETGVRPAFIHGIEAGGRYNENAFRIIHEWGQAEGFEYDDAAQLPFEEIMERSPAYLEAVNELVPGWLERGAEIVGPEGVNCYACHIRDGRPPGGDKLSWGPDLAYAKNRLRPSWIRRWVTDAQKIYPGTKMPTAIDLLRDPKLQGILEGPAELLIDAVRDYLMNSDRVSQAVPPETGK